MPKLLYIYMYIYLYHKEIFFEGINYKYTEAVINGLMLIPVNLSMDTYTTFIILYTHILL